MLLKKAGGMLCVRFVIVVIITKRISEEILICECLCVLLREELTCNRAVCY